MKEFLSRAGYPFETRNVDEDDRAYDELMAMRIMAVPVTVIDERIVRGFDPAQLREALAAAGGRSPSDR
ncbi:MAG: glutaredoxin family protein [Vicinamibacterales bacterium]